MSSFQIILHDTRIVYDCSDEQTVLRGMEKLGIKGIPVGCRGGGCGVCKVHVLDGLYTTKKMSRAHISENEEAAGYVLACRCMPDSDLRLKIVGEMKDAIVASS